MTSILRRPLTFIFTALLMGVWLPSSEASELGGGAEPGSTLRSGKKGPLKVFVLAGQSNMQGHAKVTTLAALADDPETAELYAKLVDDGGEPRVFDDIRITSIGSSKDEKVGALSVGYGAEAGGPKIGPELVFGVTVQEQLDEPILLIKTSWGGKSLHTDFRSPSAGPYVFSKAQLERMEKQGKDIEAERALKAKATGHYYRLMIEHVNDVLSDVKRVVPGYRKSQGYELAGFIWFQGWNDMVDSGTYPDRGNPGGYDAYTDALVHFIRDVRRDLDAPELPFVIGVLGVGGPTELYGKGEQRYVRTHQNFRDAMAAPASLPEFAGSVQAVLTELCWDLRASDLRGREETLRPVNKKIEERRKAGELTKAEAKEAREAARREAFSEDELAYMAGNISNAAYHYLGSAKILTGVGEALADGWSAAAGGGEQAGPAWIWLDETEGDSEVIFRRKVVLEEAPARALLAGSCDNHMIVLINGERVGSHGRWENVASRDVAAALVAGENTIEVRARNEGGPAGLALRLEVQDGPTVVSDGSWQAALAQRARRGRFGKATVLGMVGDEALPWSGTVSLASFDSPRVEMSGGDPGKPQVARDAEAVNAPEGFKVDLLYSVPNELHGSWVSMTVDDQGRLYTSDQGSRGIFRVTPAPIGEAAAVTVVEPIDVDISGAQGMLWAFDSLYVNVYGKGLFRIRDTDGDDQLDASEHLIPLGSGGEHGPHAIHLTEDGTGLYFIGGNHVRAPEYKGSRAPDNWGEDLLLPRLWDAQGHARGILAPGGWVARCDPDGANVEIISTGYRNQYDIALNPEGEMFTYDADMEYDQGSPWYRPTRVCHVTSGSEFGWRSGTGKWPTYYEDSVPPVLEIGPGSPTGIVFGTGAKFPARFQEALFILDWTFGTIYSVQLEPVGASYRATKEDFVWSKPLGVTDAVVGADGALYFTVGGRGSQSALYRVHYAGEESTEPVVPEVGPESAASARKTRRLLESFHGRVDAQAVDAAWPYLGNDDRALRFAARIAIENQPVETWRERALTETSPQAAAMGLMALARQGAARDLGPVMDALGRFPLDEVESGVGLSLLRVYALSFVRLGEPGPELKAQVRGVLEPHFPAAAGSSASRAADAMNVELARLLTYLDSAKVVAKTLELMASGEPVELPPWAELIKRNDTYGGPIARMLEDMPPTQNIEYALILMTATEGWTMPLRRQYFSFFKEASSHSGGASYAGFLRNIRREAADLLSVTDERSLATLIGQPLVAPLPDDIAPPEGPGQAWTLADAVAAVGSDLSGSDFKRGKNFYHAVSCSKCHRFAGEGGAIGPDLSTVANKFSIADILEAIVEPNKVISDQYGSHIIVDTDGVVEEGILVDEGDVLALYPRDVSQEPLIYERSEIDVIKESPTSQMPGGLIDPMAADELRDLIAFLVSGGNDKDPMFANKGTGGEKR